MTIGYRRSPDRCQGRAPWRLALVVAAVIVALPSVAGAHFERVQVGPRGIAFGRAYSALADDASAPYWNPAALVTMRTGEILLEQSKPFLVDNLGASFASVALHRGRSSLAVSWHHTGVEDVVGEDLFYLAVARDVLAPGGSFALAVGGNLKLATVGYTARADQDYGRQTKVTADLAALLNLSPTIALSGVVRNVAEPTFDFVPGGGGTPLTRGYDVGLSYRWHTESTFAVTTSRDAAGDWSLNGGAEIAFYEVLALRAGLTGGDFATGVGLTTEHFDVDVAVITHDVLGISYEVGLRVPIGAPRW